MTTKQILDLDYREEKNKKIIQKCLCKFKPFAKYSDEIVPLEMLEKFMCKLSIKYQIYPQYITPIYLKNEVIQYSISIKRTDTNDWLGSVYACCLYELVAKSCIKMYSDIKKENIPERNDV